MAAKIAAVLSLTSPWAPSVVARSAVTTTVGNLHGPEQGAEVWGSADLVSAIEAPP